MRRQEVISCGVLGGRSPKTGKPVGERHRWSGGAWGVGTCIFCGRYLEEVLRAPAQTLSLEAALQKGEQEARQDCWQATYWAGDFGIPSGWYVMRRLVGTEWLKGSDQKLRRFETQAEAEEAISKEEAEGADRENRKP